VHRRAPSSFRGCPLPQHLQARSCSQVHLSASLGRACPGSRRRLFLARSVQRAPTPTSSLPCTPTSSPAAACAGSPTVSVSDAKQQQQLRLLVTVRFAMRVPAKLASMVSFRRHRRPPPRTKLRCDLSVITPSSSSAPRTPDYGNHSPTSLCSKLS
jgi:hypothetical protein